MIDYIIGALNINKTMIEEILYDYYIDRLPNSSKHKLLKVSKSTKIRNSFKKLGIHIKKMESSNKKNSQIRGGIKTQRFKIINELILRSKHKGTTGFQCSKNQSPKSSILINILKYLFNKINKEILNINNFTSKNLCFIIEVTLRYLQNTRNELYFYRDIKKFLSKFKI